MVDFIIRTSDPAHFRDEIVAHFQKLRHDAKVHAEFRNQSAKTRLAWQTRVDVLDEAIAFTSKIKIEPSP